VIYVIPEWVRYWQQKAKTVRYEARRLDDRGYPELAEQYREEAEEIERRFLADAVLVEESAIAVPAEPTLNFEDLKELEKRYLDGDR
jgi:hypothetical protein